MKKQNSDLVLNGNIYEVLLKLSIPIMINSIIQTLYNLVDGIYVSQISSVHFAATSFVWPINFLFVSLGMGLSVAGTSILSQLIGKKREEEARDYASQLILITFMISILFAAVGYFLSPHLISLMRAEGELFQYGNEYLRVTFLDLPFMFLFFNINSIMNAQGDTLTPTLLGVVSGIINIILDPIFIFDYNMGVAGAAWATLISKLILAILGYIMLFTRRNKIKPKMRGIRLDKKISKEILSVAIPASAGQSGSALGFMVLNFFINSYGTATVAAFGMVNRISGLIMQPAMGIGSALTAIVGQNLGAGKIDRVKEAFKKGIVLAIGIGVVGGVLMVVFDQQIIDIFMQSKDDPSVISLSLVYLFYTSLSMPLMGMFSVFQGIFQGSGHTEYSMAMEVGRLWFVRLPMILLFKWFADFGSTGIWFSMSFSNLIVCIYGYWVYRSGKWEQSTLTVN